MNRNNLFLDVPESTAQEIFEEIINTRHVRIERIISNGQATPDGEWYDQELNEFVILLKGRANILFEENCCLLELKPGDFINIPAHARHRVEWTDENQACIWLVVHYM